MTDTGAYWRGQDDRSLAVTWRVLGEVLDERVHQVTERGWDYAHDDRHSVQAWAWLLLRRVSDLSLPAELSGSFTTEDARRLLLEIAAISVAALESLTRLAAEPPES